MPPTYLDFAAYIDHFELFYRNIWNLDILSNEDLNCIKTRTKKIALSSYRKYNNGVPQHLSIDEFLASQNLRKNKDNGILKSDKRNSVVIVHETDYLDKMENLLHDACKF